MNARCRFAAILLLAASASQGRALEPKDVILVVNVRIPQSIKVAEHYCDRRGVPRENIVTLSLPAGEDVSRKDYDDKIKAPLRIALAKRRDQVKVLVTTFGMPLRVGAQQPTADEKLELGLIKKDLAELQTAQSEARAALAALESAGQERGAMDLTARLEARRKELADVDAKIRLLTERQRHVTHAESQASVDSELALLWWDNYDLRRWQINLLNFQVPEELRRARPEVLMVARLDGPTMAIAKRLVDDAIAVEQEGLVGKVYVDARGIAFDPATDTGHAYGGYDESLREMARLLQSAGMDVTLDDRPELFAPGTCPDCALYCGWYSLATYVDCCRFVRGAVAYHIASSEAVSLRSGTFWCKRMLDNGVAATLGPVDEPYTVGFPKPAEFFGLLATGKYTLVECYAKTLLFQSWMTVLVGDPLYNPFAKKPYLKVEQVKPSPLGGKFLLRDARK